MFGRYIVCTPEQVVMEHKEGLPVRHLGRFESIFVAQHHMRYLGSYLLHLAVWDVRNQTVVAKLEQDELEHDPMAPAIPVFERVKVAGAISWRKRVYDYHNAFRDDTDAETEASGKQTGESGSKKPREASS